MSFHPFETDGLGRATTTQGDKFHPSLFLRITSGHASFFVV